MNTQVSFEIAKLLKEKGFDKSTASNWWILAKDHSENYNKKLPVDESKIFFTKDSDELEIKTQIDEDTQHNVYHVLRAPTIAEVVMWLYEKHGVWIEVRKSYLGGFVPVVKDPRKELDKFNSPTEAYEAAITYTLNNLI